tara:strand:- start:104 stop:742 length:639 start_codon:yes stop_codon:yes gene_type:complete
MYNLIIVIPCYNEKNISNLIRKLKDYAIIIVDDGSKTNIKDIINENNKIKIIRNKVNRGYEYSLVKGLKAAAKNYYKYVLTMDADGEHLKSNIEKSYNYVKKNKIDLLIGSRSRFNRFSEKVLSLLFSLKYKIKDPLSGFKIYKIDSLRKIINKNKFKEDFLIDLIRVFIDKKLKVRNYDIKSSKKPRRPSSMSNIKTQFKILSLLKYLLKI